MKNKDTFLYFASSIKKQKKYGDSTGNRQNTPGSKGER